MHVIYYVPTGTQTIPLTSESFNPQVYEADTQKESGWLTIEEFAAAFAPSELLPTNLKDARAAALEALRLRKWQAKNAGITVDGISIDTDDRGQAAINGAATNCLLDPDFIAQWKTTAINQNGTAVWVSIGKDEIIGLSAALSAHTEACFAVEARKQAEIAALESAEAVQEWLVEHLDEGWPVVEAVDMAAQSDCSS